jgi:myo-inositol-1(or 4)-monophosphatase
VTSTQTFARAPDPADLAAFAVRLATGAADQINSGLTELRTAGLVIDSKSTLTDLVTASDRASEQWLVAEILRVRPEDGVLGEEGADRHGTSGVRWVIDPIDGTVNFVLGLPAFAVSVAAEVHGTVVAGAVCNIATGELFHAAAGGGAFLADQRLTGPRDVALARAVVGTGFGYDAERRTRQVAVVAELLPRVADIRRMGAASLDLCSVAAGRLDGYFEAGLNPWDYAAGALIAAEAGCVVGGLRSEPVSATMTVAAGSSFAGDLIALLEELDADRVL